MKTAIFLFAFATPCLCTAPACAVDGVADTQVVEAKNTATYTAVRKSKSLRHRLRMSSMASVSAPSDPNTKTQLSEYISRLDSLKLPPVRTTKPKTASSTDPGATRTNDTAPAEPNDPAIDADVARKEYDRKIAAMLAEPDRIVHPLAVGNALYAGKDYVNAAKFYRLAIGRMSDEQTYPDRPWALFQAGNSLRFDDKAAAVKFYDLLISEFPNSPWTPAAKVEQTIATWSATQNPETLLEKYTSDPNSL